MIVILLLRLQSKGLFLGNDFVESLLFIFLLIHFHRIQIKNMTILFSLQIQNPISKNQFWFWKETE